MSEQRHVFDGQMKLPGRLDIGAGSVNKGTHDEYFHDDDDDACRHGPTDREEKGRHIHARSFTRIRNVCAQARQHVGERDAEHGYARGGETGGTKGNLASVAMLVHKKVCGREQNEVHMVTVEEVKEMMIASEAYFVNNGRVLKLEEMNGLKHNVIVHAVRKLHD